MKPVPIGAILIVIGVVLFIIAVVPFYSGTDNFLNETHTISAGYFYMISYTFSGGNSIHIAFTVSGGAVDFWVMDEGEYDHFKNDEGFNYYTTPSTRSVSTTSLDWVPPQNEKVCFIWENTGSGSKSVAMSFSSNYPGFLPDWARFVVGGLGGVLFFTGLSKTRSPRAPVGSPVPQPPIPSGAVEDTKFCRYCGAENKTDAEFCKKCGRRIGKS